MSRVPQGLEALKKAAIGASFGIVPSRALARSAAYSACPCGHVPERRKLSRQEKVVLKGLARLARKGFAVLAHWEGQAP